MAVKGRLIFIKYVFAAELTPLADMEILQWKFRQLKKAGFKEDLRCSKSKPIMRFTIDYFYCIFIQLSLSRV